MGPAPPQPPGCLLLPHPCQGSLCSFTVHSFASSPVSGSPSPGILVHLGFCLPFPALGSLSGSRSLRGLCSGLGLVTPIHASLPLSSFPIVSAVPPLCLSSFLSQLLSGQPSRHLCWVDRDPRLSKFVTNFLLLTDTQSLPMKKRGDGSREDSRIAV